MKQLPLPKWRRFIKGTAATFANRAKRQTFCKNKRGHTEAADWKLSEPAENLFREAACPRQEKIGNIATKKPTMVFDALRDLTKKNLTVLFCGTGEIKKTLYLFRQNGYNEKNHPKSSAEGTRTPPIFGAADEADNRENRLGANARK